MSVSLQDLLDPGKTALVTVECQGATLGEEAALPELSRAARESGMVSAVVDLVKAARLAGVRVLHCTAETRSDFAGANSNARLFMGIRRGKVQLTPNTPASQVISQLAGDESDIVIPRLHGLSPVFGTQTDFVLRNLGINSVVVVGVSVNVAITNAVFDLVNLGYQVVLPRDCVAGVGAEYVDAVIDNTLSLVSTVCNSGTIHQVWATHRSALGT